MVRRMPRGEGSGLRYVLALYLQSEFGTLTNGNGRIDFIRTRYHPFDQNSDAAPVESWEVA